MVGKPSASKSRERDLQLAILGNENRRDKNDVVVLALADLHVRVVKSIGERDLPG